MVDSDNEHVNENLLSLVMYELAFYFGQIELDILKGPAYEFKSYWTGRTFFDLIQNRLMWRTIRP